MNKKFNQVIFLATGENIIETIKSVLEDEKLSLMAVNDIKNLINLALENPITREQILFIDSTLLPPDHVEKLRTISLYFEKIILYQTHIDDKFMTLLELINPTYFLTEKISPEHFLCILKYLNVNNNSSHNKKFQEISLILTHKEKILFDYLSDSINSGKFITKSEIIQNVWNQTHVGEKTLEVHISNIRKKIGPFGIYIASKYRCGFKLEVENHLSNSKEMA